MHAGQHLDQRRLAGAVLPHERVHFAGAQREIHARQRLHAGECAGDAPRLEHDRGIGAHQYLRCWIFCFAVSMVKTCSSTTMRLGMVRPATTSVADVMSCGPSSGLHSMVALSLPAIMASKAPFTASMDTTRISRPGRMPASSMAWMAPMAMSSLCA